LDLNRYFPRDANYPEYSTHPSALIRPELVKLYCRQKAYEKVYKKEKKEDKKDEKKDEKQPEETETYLAALKAITFNVDAFTNVTLADSEEKIAKDKEDIIALSKYLVETVIPDFIKDLKALTICPVDGQSLTQIMHDRGINMRYLGKIATLAQAEKITFVEELAVQEMIVRASKHLLAEQMRLVKPDRSKHVRSPDFRSDFFPPSCCNRSFPFPFFLLADGSLVLGPLCLTFLELVAGSQLRWCWSHRRATGWCFSDVEAFEEQRCFHGEEGNFHDDYLISSR
jgi:protein TIF31